MAREPDCLLLLTNRRGFHSLHGRGHNVAFDRIGRAEYGLDWSCICSMVKLIDFRRNPVISMLAENSTEVVYERIALLTGQPSFVFVKPRNIGRPRIS